MCRSTLLSLITIFSFSTLTGCVDVIAPEPIEPSASASIELPPAFYPEQNMGVGGFAFNKITFYTAPGVEAPVELVSKSASPVMRITSFRQVGTVEIETGRIRWDVEVNFEAMREGVEHFEFVLRDNPNARSPFRVKVYPPFNP